MLIGIITQYLAEHKRLVVPQLGAFIVKTPGESVLFSELLRRDDGVLRGLLVARGMSDLEAAGVIDRFVFEVRHAAQTGESYDLPGLGRMQGRPDGTLAFVYTPGKAPAAAAASPSEAVERGVSPRPSGPARASVRESQPAGRTEELPKKITPDPSLKGLRYGKPRKNTDAFTFVEKREGRRIDKFVVVAIVAVLAAVAAITYGYFRELREERAAREEFVIPVPDLTAEPVQSEAYGH